MEVPSDMHSTLAIYGHCCALFLLLFASFSDASHYCTRNNISMYGYRYNCFLNHSPPKFLLDGIASLFDLIKLGLIQAQFTPTDPSPSFALNAVPAKYPPTLRGRAVN